MSDPDGRRACGKDTTCQLAQGARGGTEQFNPSSKDSKGSKSEVRQAGSGQEKHGNKEGVKLGGGIRQPLYCEGGADYDFMCNQNEYISGDITSDEFADRTHRQGIGGMAGATIGGVPEAVIALRLVCMFARHGYEIKFGNNFRLAPFGNRTGHPIGRWPHYHRRGTFDPAKGGAKDGQGIGHHRPREKNQHDKSSLDRF